MVPRTAGSNPATPATNPKKFNENNDARSLQTPVVSQLREAVTPAVTHDLARYARQRRPIRSSRRPHHAGPYLLRRGRIYYFRKRLPRCGSNPASNQFLCLSLRTDLPLHAVKRAARLLTVYEQKEQDIVDALKDGLLKPETAKAILTELLRAELARILFSLQRFQRL